jgi:hypothetical protein
MDCTRDEFLARARFTLHQDSRACRRYSLDPFEHFFQCRATANELLKFTWARTLIAAVITALTIAGRRHAKAAAHRAPSFSF